MSGLSDLERIVQTCRGFGTKVAVCVNKADVSPESTAAVARFCAEEAIPLLGTIPYDRAVPEAINAGRALRRWIRRRGMLCGRYLMNVWRYFTNDHFNGGFYHENRSSKHRCNDDGAFRSLRELQHL